ncbi:MULTISPECIES: hypothetical protein [unclassified Providencia]|uniref:hypothetical protein n=1 Tax=unclassified Providencia TaxID=2633465 RepID=UPI00234B3BCF|nr:MULTISPECIES: hypothetical protein [unclassified Providencia]
MEFKGTPAPWLTDRNNVHTGRIATLHGCENNSWVEIWSTNWPESESVQEANAYLIAAAPELLEALQRLLKYHDDFYGIEPDEDHDHPLSVAKAAIAKAIGQQ